MSYATAQRVLAILAIVPAIATVYFYAFWTAFSFWRRHRVLTYTFMLGTIGGFAVAVVLLRAHVLALGVAMPPLVQALGWLLVTIACGFGFFADRQIGFRVRSFAPFFDDHGRIELVTTGAYGVVRHPIYASGIWFQLGTLLVTGSLAVAFACAVLTAGALWFTRQEERRLVELLADPTAYDRYRARVPALFPWPR